MSRARSKFHPRMVPEIRNGYFWLVKDMTGFGTTSFRVPEGNKHTNFDLLQATVASQFTLLTENGGLQARMRPTGDPNPSLLASVAVQAGWTGPTYVGMWIRVPNAAGDLTGTMTFFSHATSVGNQRRFRFSAASASPDRYTFTLSTDGTNQASNLTQLAYDTTANWIWREQIFDFGLQLGGTAPTDIVKVFANFVRLLPLTAAPSAGFTQLFNANATIEIGAQQAFNNVDTMDWTTAYYCPGIPSLKNRKRIANYLNPSNVHFQVW